jgi:hypothetical protein
MQKDLQAILELGWIGHFKDLEAGMGPFTGHNRSMV